MSASASPPAVPAPPALRSSRAVTAPAAAASAAASASAERPKRKRGADGDDEAQVEGAPKRMVQPTMERFSRRVAESAADAAAREAKMNPFGLEWKQQHTLLYMVSKPDSSSPLSNSSKIAAFDMDNTLLRTRSGRKFPTGRSDWLWLFSCIPSRLRQLHAEGWKLVIFTNQNGIATGNQNAGEIKGKILDIIKDAGVPMHAFVASADDLYRKPAVDMWTFMEQQCNGGVKVDKQLSVYVGDAAGRPAKWDGALATKKDFSCSDRKFAFNVGVNFATPEEYFLDAAPAPFSWGGIDPTLLSPKVQDPATPHPSASVAPLPQEAASPSPKPALQRGGRKSPSMAADAAVAAASPSPSPSPVAALRDLSLDGAASSPPAAAAGVPARAASPSSPVFHSTGQELVLFCGLPASGKSTFARKHLVPHGYIHVNQDTLKTKEKCVKLCGESLSQGLSVVVDNTNPSAEVRALYIAHARKHGVPVRCFHFVTALDVAKHLNMFREKLTQGAHRHVPRIAYAMFNKNWKAPTIAEGFKEIKQIDFVPYFAPTPAGEEAKKLFYQMS